MPTPSTEKEVTARWKIVAGVILAICTTTGGASTFFYQKGLHQGSEAVTTDDLRSFKEAIVGEVKAELKKAEGLGDRVLALEKESQFNRQMLLALSAELKPGIANLQTDMNKALQSIEYMRAKLEDKVETRKP